MTPLCRGCSTHEISGSHWSSSLSGGPGADEHAAEASAGTIHSRPFSRQNISTRGLTNAQVGRTLMGTQQMRERAGGKGRCVELLHAFGDMLCAFGSFWFLLDPSRSFWSLWFLHACTWQSVMLCVAVLLHACTPGIQAHRQHRPGRASCTFVSSRWGCRNTLCRCSKCCSQSHAAGLDQADQKCRHD